MAKKHRAVLIGFLVIQLLPLTLHADETSPKSPPNLIAEVRQRLETDRLEVRVYKGKELVQLADFSDLYIVTPLPAAPQMIEKLFKSRRVAIFKSEKNSARWEVYQDVWIGTGGDRELTLADNVFKVKQVLVSTDQNPIEIRLDEKVIHLKPGDALLVL
jgi:hypothetical protein